MPILYVCPFTCLTKISVGSAITIRVRLEMFIVVTVKVAVFWDVTPCKLVEVYWHISGTCCLHLQGTRTQRQSSSVTLIHPLYLQGHTASHPRIQYWLPVFMLLSCSTPDACCCFSFLAPCTSLELGAHLCMKYCVTSSMGRIYCLTVLSCRIGFCTLVRNRRHASPCLQHSPWC
jgi:hypothetical protein